uniref:Uncharacterized protein n=1 Tax=Arundo donax TaxID=35708 RepID=A0A0A9FKA6_ARUDO
MAAMTVFNPSSSPKHASPSPVNKSP